MTDSRNSRKVRTGVVTSVSGAKTIVVTITERKRHPKYGKMMTSSKKLHAPRSTRRLSPPLSPWATPSALWRPVLCPR